MERLAAKSFANEFRRVSVRAARAFEQDGKVGVAVALSDHADALEKIMTLTMRRALMTFGSRVESDAKSHRILLEVKDGRSEFSRRAEQYILHNAAGKVRRVAETTQRQIARIIAAGEEEGLAATAIAKSLRTKYPRLLGALRSVVIARTEVHAAANAASHEAIEAYDLEKQVKKQWVSAEDDRTRDTHLEADGQVVEYDELFIVGGAELEFPGDPAGPPEEIINCRCIPIYITPEP